MIMRVEYSTLKSCFLGPFIKDQNVLLLCYSHLFMAIILNGKQQIYFLLQHFSTTGNWILPVPSIFLDLMLHMPWLCWFSSLLLGDFNPLMPKPAYSSHSILLCLTRDNFTHQWGTPGDNGLRVSEYSSFPLSSKTNNDIYFAFIWFPVFPLNQ